MAAYSAQKTLQVTRPFVSKAGGDVEALLKERSEQNERHKSWFARSRERLGESSWKVNALHRGQSSHVLLELDNQVPWGG